MSKLIELDNFHRLAKSFMDEGKASSYEEALGMLRKMRLAIRVGPQIAESSTLQAALLTAVNTGRRCFLGGVEICGQLDVPLRLGWPRQETLAEAVASLQGIQVESVPSDIPWVVIGDDLPKMDTSPFCVRAVCDGWRGGIIPIDSSKKIPLSMEFTPSGVLAGALAVSEAFQHLRGGNPYAGRRVLGLSLWEPERSEGWLDSDTGPEPRALPSRAWLIGLGHLGQAYLWTLGLMPYTHREEVELVLQDIDELSAANDSTSLLTSPGMIGMKKTRAMAAWCDAMGFRSRIVERKFSSDFHVSRDEPNIGICGVDNPEARRILEDVGFDAVLEAGLGSTATDFLGFQVHSFPAPRKAQDIWGIRDKSDDAKENAPLPAAYQPKGPDGIDRCGLVQLAGRSVGSSFVGTVVSTLVIADLIRISMRGWRYATIVGDLRTGKIKSIRNPIPSDWINPWLTYL